MCILVSASDHATAAPEAPAPMIRTSTGSFIPPPFGHSGLVRRTRPGISRFRVRCFASPRNDEHKLAVTASRAKRYGQTGSPVKGRSLAATLQARHAWIEHLFGWPGPASLVGLGSSANGIEESPLPLGEVDLRSKSGEGLPSIEGVKAPHPDCFAIRPLRAGER